MTKINVSLKPYLTNNRRLPTKLMEGLTIHLGSKKKKPNRVTMVNLVGPLLEMM